MKPWNDLWKNLYRAYQKEYLPPSRHYMCILEIYMGELIGVTFSRDSIEKNYGDVIHEWCRMLLHQREYQTSHHLIFIANKGKYIDALQVY